MDNHELASVFGRIADLMEFIDENPFKSRAYRMAAEVIEDARASVADIARRGGTDELQKIPGIGKSISSQIVELIRTGKSSALEEIKKRIPETVLELRRVPGIGLKTSQLLYRDFGIKNLSDLKAFTDGGGLYSVQGLGEKVIKKITVYLNEMVEAD
jgi:DNA polymerase (family 10)